ncbi:hypothetical protein IQ268_16115 [Oculatella sp. LEGE 06141]|uniref:hypothetical protein n=1 Tax=Oculatella sp. LEGE 06141 TaxID=1828648 RepID=UPI001881E8D7|nr:hypothetical protein [Oculatella sp. LEGE 06141]MBE9180097.1 hypothetical protein [Oculatella sp. LEGE 06141]
MINLISGTIARINSQLKGIQVSRFLAVVLTGFLLLTTNVDSGRNNQTLGKKLDNTLHQIDSERPKTTGEWYDEARQTEDSLGDRVGNIAEESAQAVKEWGALYPNTAKRSGQALEDNASR